MLKSIFKNRGQWLIGLFVAMFATLVYATTTVTGSVSIPSLTPTYTPNAVVSVTNPLASGAQNIVFPTGGNSTVSLIFQGTCTGLSFSVYGSIDNGATYPQQLNIYPYPAIGAAAMSAAASPGTYTTASKVVKANIQGVNWVQVQVTGLSVNTCNFYATMSPSAVSGAYQ